MSDLDIFLFAIGVAVFMVTVYGVVMAGGFALQRRQREELADDVDIIVNSEGYEVMTSTTAARVDHAPSREPTI